ncbi:Rqc2 family fibronectin-binding protein [Bacillus sp. AK031]
MSFDGLFTKAMTEELGGILKGGRINKIHQPYKNEVILIVRSQGKNHKLLLSAHPSYARAQLTSQSYENPSVPPMFCMLLRKHLEGYIIEDVYQKEVDRIIIFEIKGRSEIGDVSYKQLIIEIMGRHSNIVIVDKNRNMILDSIKHIPPSINSYRTVLPGQEYKFPPPQDKKNPLQAEQDDILKAIDFNSGKLDKQIVGAFSGVSPLFAKEAVYRAGLANRNSLPSALLSILDSVKKQNYQPTLIRSTKEIFYFLDLQHIEGEHTHFPNLSELLDRYFHQKAERDRVKQQGNDLERLLKNELEKNQGKIVKLEKTLKDAENADTYQLYGELLTANLYAVERGMSEIEVMNYYDEEGGTVKIELDIRKTPSENAQQYFSKYSKAKTAIRIVQEQIGKAKEEIIYLEQLLQQLESASPKDILEIREELAEEGYIRAKSEKKKKKSNDKPQLEAYVSSDGTAILVGKNNKQNDYLTNKLAGKDEIWLHTKDIPGSHVVIRSKDPAEETIKEAAVLAAYFSKARESGSVPVDFTKVKNVKKPKGAKPGFVTYDEQQTVYTTPSIDSVRSMKKE